MVLSSGQLPPDPGAANKQGVFMFYFHRTSSKREVGVFSAEDRRQDTYIYKSGHFSFNFLLEEQHRHSSSLLII